MVYSRASYLDLRLSTATALHILCTHLTTSHHSSSYPIFLRALLEDQRRSIDDMDGLKMFTKLPQKIPDPFNLLGDQPKLAFRSQPGGIAKLATTRVSPSSRTVNTI